MKHKLISSAIFAASLFGCGLAGATPIALGVLGALPSTKVHTYGSGVSFLDTYTFTVSPTATQVSENVVNVLLHSPFGSGNWLDTSGLNVQIFQGGVAQIGPVQSFSGLLNPGEYYAQVAGRTSGSMGGGYAFVIGAAAAPVVFAETVPEPQTLAMVGLGLGIMGLQLRRRDRKAIKLNLS
jgi:hypothetical protein